MSGLEQDGNDDGCQDQCGDQPEPPALIERKVPVVVRVGTVEVVVDGFFDLCFAGTPVHFLFGLRLFVFELAVLLDVFLCAFVELDSGPLFGLFRSDFLESLGIAFIVMEFQFLHEQKLLYISVPF